MTVCNKDCFNCPYDDCINGVLDYDDYKELSENDKIIRDELRGEKGRKVAARNRAYRENNKEKVAAYNRAYYENNKEKVAARQRAYRENNKDKLKRLAVYERWAEENGIQIPAD